MIWISRLTLVAYLVGGWLLPAAHFHAHHGSPFHPHHQSSACGGHDDPHPVAVVEDHRHDCGHHHASCQSVGQPQPAGQGATVALVAPAHTDLACSGLCALCSARTLSSTTLAGNDLPAVRLGQPLSRFVIEPLVLPVSNAGGHFLRGPPAIV